MATNGELPKCARRLLAIQEERITAYASFDRAHKEYIETRPEYDFETFKKTVHDVTVQFSALSQEVLSISAAFKDTGNSDVVAIVEEIQEKEREKLQQTAAAQLLVKQCADFPDNEDYAESKRDLKLVLSQLDGRIAELVQDFRYECEDLLQ